MGTTVCDLLHPPAPPGWERQNVRLTKIQKTIRPDNVWVEVWRTLSDLDKKEAGAKWKVLKPLRIDARTRRGIFGIPADEQETYLKF